MNQDAVFKALADKGRRKLLDQLFKTNGLTLNELCKTLDMARQSVSKHLAILEKAGLIDIEWRGREKYHYLNSAPIQEIYARWMHKYQAHFSRELELLKASLESDKNIKEK